MAEGTSSTIKKTEAKPILKVTSTINSLDYFCSLLMLVHYKMPKDYFFLFWPSSMIKCQNTQIKI